jgi:hypothetical protein
MALLVTSRKTAYAVFAQRPLVAGAQFVPNRQFLSIPFRSELIHCAV